MKIANIKTAERKNKGFNKDLFLFDRENIEVGIFNQDRDSNQGLIYLGNEKQNNRLIEKVIMLQKDEKGLIPYSYNIMQTNYNGEKQVTVSRQALTLQGFNWLCKANDIMALQKHDDILMNYYVSELDKIGVTDSDNNLITYEDFISLCELSSNGKWLVVEFEDSNKRVKVLFNAETNCLHSIDTKLIMSSDSFTSLVGQDISQNNEEKEIEELNSFFE